METIDHSGREWHPLNRRDLLAILFKHRKMIVSIFLTTVVSVTAATLLVSPTYEAQSTLLVKFGREYTYRPELTEQAPVISASPEEAINSEVSIMTSRDLIVKVVARLQVSRLYPELLENPPASTTPFDAAVSRFKKNLTVEVLRKSNVLQVTFRHHNPETAASAVNLLVDLFKEKHYQVYNGQESRFLEDKVQAYEQRLKRSEAGLQQFKFANGVYSLDDQLALLLKQRAELDASLTGIRSHIEGLQRKRSSLQVQMKQLESNSGRYTHTERDRIVIDAKAKMLDLRLKERQLLEKYPEHSQLVTNVRREIAMVADFLQQQEEAISGKVKTGNMVYQEAEKGSLLAEAELNSELAKHKILSKRLGDLDAEIRRLDLKSMEFQSLMRETANNDKNYRIYLDRLEEARISNDMNRQKFDKLSVIQTAVPQAKPVKPKILLNILSGVVLGALFALGWVLLNEYASEGLATAEAAQRRLGLRVIATVPLRN